MSRRCGLAAIGLLFFGPLLCADDQALWHEYGLVHTNSGKEGKFSVTTYEMRDTTGALAVWQWQRPADGRSCELAPFCSQDLKRTVLSDFNYVVVIEGGTPTKQVVAAAMGALPSKTDASLPAILTFLPSEGLVPNSSRYLLGPVSLNTFVPDLASAKLGFESGAEGQVAEYRIANNSHPVRLAIFNYPTPEMARIHSAELKRNPNLRVKRSGVLVALVLPGAMTEESDTLLGRVQYDAKVTWNDAPPPGPIKPLYQLLINIIILSLILGGICLLAGLIYAGMRLYRRRYGTLEADESMTTLHLS
jgi:uncharacterized protein DUF6599